MLRCQISGPIFGTWERAKGWFEWSGLGFEVDELGDVGWFCFFEEDCGGC